jgi:hypothetical protein
MTTEQLKPVDNNGDLPARRGAHRADPKPVRATGTLPFLLALTVAALAAFLWWVSRAPSEPEYRIPAPTVSTVGGFPELEKRTFATGYCRFMTAAEASRLTGESANIVARTKVVEDDGNQRTPCTYFTASGKRLTIVQIEGQNLTAYDNATNATSKPIAGLDDALGEVRVDPAGTYYANVGGARVEISTPGYTTAKGKELVIKTLTLLNDLPA